MDTNLLASSLGNVFGSEDHTSTYEELYSQLITLIEDDSKRPKCHTFFSRDHNWYSCKYYVDSNIEYIMNNSDS